MCFGSLDLGEVKWLSRHRRTSRLLGLVKILLVHVPTLSYDVMFNMIKQIVWGHLAWNRSRRVEGLALVALLWLNGLDGLVVLDRLELEGGVGSYM